MTQPNSETRYFFVVSSGMFKGHHEVVPEGLTGSELEEGIKAVEKHLRDTLVGNDVSELIRTKDVVKDVVNKHNFDMYTHKCYSAKEHLNGNGKKDLKEGPESSK